MSEGTLVARLQQEVADRHPIDWNALMSELRATNGASPDVMREVVLLRLLDEMGQANSAFQSDAFEDDSEQSSTVAVAKPLDDTLDAWGRYVLDQKVGRGGFGNVYRAWDPLLEMPVAIKILHRKFDDEKWEKLEDPAVLKKPAGPGKFSMFWYRTKVTIPEKVGDVDVAGSQVPLEPYILVCPSTDPAWVPLFVQARGLVMETGGMLSHGAIRELCAGRSLTAGIVRHMSSRSRTSCRRSFHIRTPSRFAKWHRTKARY